MVVNALLAPDRSVKFATALRLILSECLRSDAVALARGCCLVCWLKTLASVRVLTRLCDGWGRVRVDLWPSIKLCVFVMVADFLENICLCNRN